MICSPRTNDIVQLWYADKTLPYQGYLAQVVISGRGKPRNHLVYVFGAGEKVVVPCGNIRKIGEK